VDEIGIVEHGHEQVGAVQMQCERERAGNQTVKGDVGMGFPDTLRGREGRADARVRAVGNAQILQARAVGQGVLRDRRRVFVGPGQLAPQGFGLDLEVERHRNAVGSVSFDRRVGSFDQKVFRLQNLGCRGADQRAGMAS